MQDPDAYLTRILQDNRPILTGDSDILQLCSDYIKLV